MLGLILVAVMVGLMLAMLFWSVVIAWRMFAMLSRVARAVVRRASITEAINGDYRGFGSIT